MSKSNKEIKQLGACLAILASLTATSANAMDQVRIDVERLTQRYNEYQDDLALAAAFAPAHWDDLMRFPFFPADIQRECMECMADSVSAALRYEEDMAVGISHLLQDTANMDKNLFLTSRRFTGNNRDEEIIRQLGDWRSVWQSELNHFNRLEAEGALALQELERVLQRQAQPQQPIVAQPQQPVVIQPQPVVDQAQPIVDQAQQQNAQMQEVAPNQAEVAEVGVFRRIGNFFSRVFSGAVNWVRGLFGRRDPEEEALRLSLLGNV